MSYDELRIKLIIYEKTYLHRHGREKKRLNVVLKTFLEEIENELDDDEEDLEDLEMIVKGMNKIMRRRKQSTRSQIDQISGKNNGRRSNKGPA